MSDVASITIRVSDMAKPAVYVWRNADDSVAYVGRTVNFMNRVGCHIVGDGADWLSADCETVDIHLCETTEAAANLERALIRACDPIGNKQHTSRGIGPRPFAFQVLLEGRVPDASSEVTTARESGQSWAEIAEWLSERSGLAISRETVRRWYGEKAGAA